jgi:hypothetical protein
VVRLERPPGRDADIFGLLWRKLGQLGPDLGQMQRGDLLVQMLGQDIDLAIFL